MAVTAAQAITNYNANHNVAPQVVSDTAADLLANLSGLKTLQSAGKLASVTLIGTSNTVTASQATSLAGLTKFTVGSGATLVVADTAANLLASANSTGVSKATTVQLIGTSNTVTAAQAKTLASKPHFALAAGATLTVADTATNLLASGNSSGVSKATTVQLTGTSNKVTAAQATTLAGEPNFALASGATLVVADSATNLLAAGNSTGIAKATTVQLTGTANTVTAAQATALAALKNFALASGATLVVADSATNLLAAGYSTGIAKATTVHLTGTTNTVTAQQAAALAALKNFALVSGATLLVSDSAANLLSPTYAAGVAEATSVQLTGTNTVTAAQGAILSGLPNLTLAAGASLGVSDSAANVATNLDKLQILVAAGNLSVIVLTDSGTPVLDITPTQQTNDASAIALIKTDNSNVSVVVVQPVVPTVSDVINGISSSNNPTLNHFSEAPPDNGLAVSATDVLMVENSVIEVTSRTGTVLLGPVSSNSFFSSVLGSGYSTFDPRAIVDPKTGQFIITMDATKSNGSTTLSEVVYAVSNTTDPTQGWTYGVVNTTMTISGQSTWSDYPMAATDGTNLFVETNQFGSTVFNGDLTIIPLAGGAATTVSVGANSYMPVAVPNWGAFLVAYNGNSTLSIRSYIDGSGLQAQVTVSLGSIDIGGGTYTAAQLGSKVLIDAGDDRVPSAVYANGYLYAVFEVIPPGGTQAAVHWVKIDVSTPSNPTLVAQGTITGTPISANGVAFNPSIAVDANGDILINYTVSSPTMYAADYVSVMPAGSASFYAPVLYASSSAPETSSFAVTNNVVRWGDYSTAVADPAAANGFVVSNEIVPSAGDTVWATVTANITVPATPPPVAPVTSSSGLSSGVVLSQADSQTVVAPPSLGGDTTPVDAGLAAPSLGFLAPPGTVTLGSAATTIDFAMQPSSGIEEIANFQYGLDQLRIDLLGAAANSLLAFDTSVDGVHAVSIASANDLGAGVVLLGMTAGQTAADLLANHTTFRDGHAIVS